MSWGRWEGEGHGFDSRGGRWWEGVQVVAQGPGCREGQAMLRCMALRFTTTHPW